MSKNHWSSLGVDGGTLRIKSTWAVISSTPPAETLWPKREMFTLLKVQHQAIVLEKLKYLAEKLLFLVVAARLSSLQVDKLEQW